LKAIDLRSMFLAKHAQHVVLIHFPIALFLTGVLFDFAALWTKRTILAAAAFANLIAATVSVPVVIASGILAWQWQLGGQEPKGPLLLHLVLGSISGLLIGVTGWIHFRATRTPGGLLPGYRLPLELVAALLIVFTGHLGGVLSGVNAPG
jgi:uncharacterized membrane protein